MNKKTSNQSGLKHRIDSCILYDTKVIQRIWRNKKENELIFNTGGYHTRATCKAINYWLSLYTKLCLKAFIKKGIVHIKATPNHGADESYAVSDTLTLGAKFIRETKTNE